MRRRILFCTLNYYPAPTGGAEHQAQLQAEELARRGHAVTVVCPRVAGVTGGMINGVRVRRLYSIDRRPFRHLTHLLSLAVYLAATLRRYDLVHVHLANLQLDLAALLATLLRRPLYVKVAAGGAHGDVQRMRRVARLTRNIGLRTATRVQVLSDEILEELWPAGVRPEQVVRIANGLDTSRFHPGDPQRKAELRAKLGLPQEGVIVLFVGRISAQKGVPDLLSFWQREQPEATLVLVGSRRTVAALGELPEVAGVIHHDFTANILDYYHAVDIFTLPSYAEGMSNALLEAMACGLPSVVSRIGAASEMLTDGESGILYPRGDQQGLAVGLRRLIADADLRERMGHAAAAAIRGRYSMQATVDRIEAEYDAIAPLPAARRIAEPLEAP